MIQQQPILEFGDFTLRFVSCGRFKLDGGAMFSVVPKVIWQRTNPADERNRIQLATNALLIDDGSNKILVETGCGDKVDEKTRDIYDIERTSAAQGVRKAGIDPSEITAVINTHLHFDHAGGNTTHDEAGQAVPAFPNAVYYSQRAEWEWANSPSVRDDASYNPPDFVPIKKSGQLRLIDGASEIVPGVRVVPTPGHNSGHQSVIVQSQGKTGLYSTDLCPTSTHLNLPFIMSYDLYPLQIIETKRRMLDEAVKNDWLMMFYHDPQLYYGYLEYDDRGRVKLRQG